MRLLQRRAGAARQRESKAQTLLTFLFGFGFAASMRRAMAARHPAGAAAGLDCVVTAIARRGAY
jgi:hypothetical protein